MKSKLMVTREGLWALEERRASLLERLKEIQGQKGATVADGGDTWHDNAAFEELVRQEHAVNKQIGDIGQLIRAAVVVSGIPGDTTTVQVGHVVHLYDVKDASKMILRVGGFDGSDSNTIPPTVGYNAPMLREFFGQEEGHEATVKVFGKRRDIVLETITLGVLG